MKRIGCLLVGLLFVLVSCESRFTYNPMKCTLYQMKCDQGEVEYCELAEECLREQDERD